MNTYANLLLWVVPIFYLLIIIEITYVYLVLFFLETNYFKKNKVELESIFKVSLENQFKYSN